MPAILIKRYKRFLADVTLPTGEMTTVACPNTGSMLGLAEPGSRIFLSRSASPTRKYPLTWEMTERPGIGLVGINTGLPNGIVEEAVRGGAIGKLRGYANIRREVKYGVNSRIDLLLEGAGLPKCYVEVKAVTLIRQSELAEFPDCVTERGAKHLRELSQMVRLGHRAVMVYLAQCANPSRFTLTRDLDPVYVETFIAAQKSGVEAIALTCHVSPDSITIKDEIPIVAP